MSLSDITIEHLILPEIDNFWIFFLQKSAKDSRFLDQKTIIKNCYELWGNEISGTINGTQKIFSIDQNWLPEIDNFWQFLNRKLPNIVCFCIRKLRPKLERNEVSGTRNGNQKIFSVDQNWLSEIDNFWQFLYRKLPRKGN